MLSKEYKEQIAELGTETQAKYYKAYCEVGSMRGVSRDFGINKNVVNRSLESLERKAAAKGLIDAYDQDAGTSSGFAVKGTSSYYNKDGERIGLWVKTDREKENAEEAIRAMVRALAEDVEGKSNVPECSHHCTDDLMSLYMMFDRHVGMMTWGAEVGEDYDLKIAEGFEDAIATRLVSSQPASKTAIVAFGGDYLHADDDNQVTPAHKNKVDVDGRADRVLEVGIRIARNLIDKAAEKHEEVYVYVVPGNHDPEACKALKYILLAYYSNSDRVNVINTHGVFAYHKFGCSLLAFQHGDKMKHERMYQTISTDRKSDWASVDFVDVYTGHIHTEKVSSIGMCRFESVPTPIPRDAYAHSHGFRSRRCSHAVTYHNDEGVVGRTVHNIKG